MICSRSLAVSKKKASATMKSIDNSLLRYDNQTGEVFSISSRCADMDAELPLHLGVPKAILDNVIFCHQEESNWPLSEPGVLKKRFDEIFSSKKYQAALDNIKDVKKELHENIKIGNVRLDALKADTEKAKRIRSNLTQLNQQTAAKLNTLDLVDTKINQIHQKVTKLKDTFRDFNLTADQIQQIINKRDFYMSTINSIKDTITPRSESTEELKIMLRNHQMNESKVTGERTELLSEKSKLERKLKSAQDELSQKHTAIGRLMAAKEQIEQQIQTRIELIEKINSTHGMSMSIHDGPKVATSLRKHVTSLQTKQKKDKTAALTRQNTLSDELQLLRSRHLSIIESKKRLTKLIEDDKAQIQAHKNRLLEFEVSTSEIEDAKARVEREVNNKETSSELNDEMNRLSKQSDTSAKLSLKRTEKESKELILNRLYEECTESVQSIIGKKPTKQDLERELLTFKREREKNIYDLKALRNQANNEASAADGKIGVARHHISVRKREIEKHQATIHAACGDTEFMEALAQNEKVIEDVKEQLANIRGAELIYGKFFERAQNSKCCPLCTRSFNEDVENDAFQGKLQTIMQRIPDQRERLNNKLKTNEDKRIRLRAAQGSYIKLETLNKDIANLEKNLGEFEKEKENASNRADVASAELIEIENYTNKIDKTLKTAEEITRLLKECNALQRDISELENELNFMGSTRTMTDCQKDMEEISMKSMGKIEKDISPLEAQVEETAAAHEKAMGEWRIAEENTVAEQNIFMRYIERLDELNRRISRDEATSGSAKLESAMEQCTELQKLIDRLKSQIIETTDRINALEKDESERRGIERDLQDQIKYREMQAELAKCEDELRELEEKQGSTDVSALTEQLQKAQDEETNLIDKRGSIRGELVQMRDQIRRYEAELANDYADVDGRYGQLFLDVKTKELAVSDLDKYSKVLQAAIMKYHSLKMEDLNTTIKGLWMNTYKGGDIDYIEIRADNEGSAANRTFNYRVVMFQNGSELNMRGRCSAGQKVLASIIIRLALAETFCINCGIFTLDEPTTNLDRENIESLAESLARLIARKRTQRNFQFVIITHDEEFVEYLARHDITGQQYRIKKDA
ncbi:P-loop containing nucleoside triphosphate hydrolase protein [Rhizopus microsporus var. microsporus]|uniref:DNA repair protein RAD50 n=1 Tax=Rhizopus microsporus var. microsporus TaxID=86635 RepID=A0A1X0RIR5_RHIZD|nr:P-loop containing nucleoside triphosphate hydrolase protein [Rhizopus microsporus var. microsporus]